MATSHTSAALLPGLLPRATQAPLALGVKRTIGPEQMPRYVAGSGAGGNGTVTGTVKIKGTPDYPVSRRVRLYRDLDGRLLAETWSDPVTGVYTFTGLAVGQRFTALALDHTHSFRAVVADNLEPA